ncbi:zinc transporter ZupT [Thalassoglobus neptunius]|uniref:Zinc transporter ZupT n=1 Tax=Thalassoglobus neptunius TaxID=1938619 RepID=A0A5C5WCR1_9PLAN|nr:ZIP family metal transporter [Thalassoglobus neptunius]TWT47903.1 zinc transporter ZupT [Thalassoglobus neptunius]
MDLCRLNRFSSVILPTWIVLLVAIGATPTFAQSVDSHDHDHAHVHENEDGHDHGHDHSPAEGSDPIPTKVWWLIVVYSLLIACSSLSGGILPGRISLTHTRMQHVISLVGGLMLGTAIFHLLPHSLYYMGSQGVETVALSLMAGVVTMFFLLRAFHFHQHEFPENADPNEIAKAAESGTHEHDHSDCGHTHHSQSVHEMSWVGVFIGLAIHTIIDGIALGASVQAEAGHSSAIGLFGLGTFAAIALHKPLDAVSITTLMVAGGWSNRSQLIVNIAYSLLCPIGAVVFLFGISSFAAESTTVIGTTLAFSAGVFLCISLSDLLPEMEFHSHHRRTLSAALLFGILVAWLIRFLEPAHIH